MEMRGQYAQTLVLDWHRPASKLDHVAFMLQMKIIQWRATSCCTGSYEIVLAIELNERRSTYMKRSERVHEYQIESKCGATATYWTYSEEIGKEWGRVGRAGI
jgi:hypothetical protein